MLCCGRVATLLPVSAQRPDITHNLPTLRLREFRPDRHAAADYAICHNPENSARGRLLYLVGPEARTFFPALSSLSMTFGAMRFKKLFSSGHSIRIGGKRIGSVTRFLRSLRKFGINLRA